MKPLTPEQLDRRDALLAEQVTDGLPPEARAELLTLLAASDLDVEDTWHDAASVVSLANPALGRDPVPPRLLDRLSDTADRHEAQAPPLALAPPAPVAEETTSPWSMAGWVAAAAALVVALATWFGGDRFVDAADLRAELVERHVPIVWTATDDVAASGAGGDVVWSDADQVGVMRIRGLSPNDPTESQYQLWIFDADRDERYPVDGGVFDIPAEGEEHLVPIAATLPVSKATLFAVTVEPPGGVVVSDRERIVLLATVGS